MPGTQQIRPSLGHLNGEDVRGLIYSLARDYARTGDQWYRDRAEEIERRPSLHGITR